MILIAEGISWRQIILIVWPYAVMLWSFFLILYPISLLIQRLRMHRALHASQEEMIDQEATYEPTVWSLIAFGVLPNMIAVVSGLTAICISRVNLGVASALMIVSALPLIALRVHIATLNRCMREELEADAGASKNQRMK